MAQMFQITSLSNFQMHGILFIKPAVLNIHNQTVLLNAMYKQLNIYLKQQIMKRKMYTQFYLSIETHLFQKNSVINIHLSC